MEENVRKRGKRFCIVLDLISFKTLCKIRLRHGDRSFTASIKRALATASFINEHLEQEDKIFLGNIKESGKVHEVIFL